MLQFPDALGLPPVPQGQCGTKDQGKDGEMETLLSQWDAHT